MVAVALLALILAVTASLVDSSSRIWRQANAKIESFQNARAAFDILTARLSAATLNTYWDYYDSSGTAYRLSPQPATFEPARYGRYSDLHFVTGRASDLLVPPPMGITALATQAVFFTAPSGLSANRTYRDATGLLGACGYFVGFGSDAATKPAILATPDRYRWRLMELSPPVEELEVFEASSGGAWFTTPATTGRIRPVADNVIALVVWPRRPPQDDPDGDDLTDDYTYDSRTSLPWSGTPLRQPVQAHQMPPTLHLTMVAIEEDAAKRIESGTTPPAAISTALAGLFAAVDSYEADISSLETRLADARIGFRTFSTTIALRESRWSQ
jgi:uncharacterized protein (TIGR02599 family)